MQQKWWSVFFGAVILAAFLLCVVAPFVNWWLPPNVASFGGDIDFLFYVILAFTTFFFVLTEAVLVWNMWRYAYRPGHKADYVEGNHRLEILWTVVPSAILLFIAFAQVPAWERIKYASKMPKEPSQVVQVTGRQWDWTIRYPRANPTDNSLVPPSPRKWSESGAIDDVVLPDELHCWKTKDNDKDGNVVIYLKTQDVLHSFFLPNLRLKQDALPGKTIPMWFRATDYNCRFDPATGKTTLTDPSKEWEIACAELCGGGHFRMRGHLYVHETREEYLRWLDYAFRQQQTHEAQPADRVAAHAEH